MENLKQILFGSVLLGIIWVTVAEDAQAPPPQFSNQFPVGPPTAQKRFDFMGKGKGKGGGGEVEHEPPSMHGGFGMYPLWKFHKFDGFSLRPVPIQLDIGHGIPAPPPSQMPSYGGGWGSQQSYGGSQQSGGYAPSGGYGQQQSSYGQQNSGYQQQSSGYGQQQQSGYQSSYNQAPLTMSYQAAPQPSYQSSYTQPAYGGNSQPNYGPPPAQPTSYSSPPPQTYSAPQPQSYSAPQSQSYSSEMSYGSSNAQPVTTVPGGGFGASSKVPSYAAAIFDGNAPFGGVSELSMPLDSNQGYVKRYYNIDSDSQNNQQTTNPDGDDKDAQQ